MPKHPALEKLPRGWFHHGEQMLALLEQHRPRIVVELGTYRGASAIAMARVVRQWGGVVFCVDTWYGVPRPGRPTWPARLFETGCAVVKAGVGAHVRFIAATTQEAAIAWHGPNIDCLYVDADHTAEGCAGDLALWWPHVRAGGLVAGDDYDHPKYPGVALAWELHAAFHGMPLTLQATPGTNPPEMRFVYGVKP